MILRGRELIDDFVDQHADSEVALQRWIDIVERSIWRSHVDLKRTFPATDYVGKGRYVFNIKGNHYRLVVVVVFIDGVLRVRFLGTHAEYDKIDCSTI
jgi:mRNA interferase HigB